MRGGLAVLIAAELLTLLPMNNPWRLGGDKAVYSCGPQREEARCRLEHVPRDVQAHLIPDDLSTRPLGFDSRTGRERTPILQVRDFFAR